MKSGLRKVISKELVNMNGVESIHEPVRSKTMKVLKSIVLGVLQSSDGSKSCEQVQSLSPKVFSIRDTIKHLSCALGVADVCDFVLSSNTPDQVDLSGSIMVTHLNETELPVSLILLGVEGGVTRAETVLSSSLVTKPNIIAGLN